LTAPDPEIAQKIAHLLRASRKSATLTQHAVASKLGISQGALSKMEHGLLIPSAPQWFDFCDLTSIPPESLKVGYIDRLRDTQLPAAEKASFRMPERYSSFRGTRVRALRPFISVIFAKLEGQKARDFLDTFRVDEDFFLDYDNQLNLNFVIDLAKKMIAQGWLAHDRMEALVMGTLEPASHGMLNAGYRDASGLALQNLIANAHRYECNFRYAVEEASGKSLVLSVKPESHLTEFAYRNDAQLGDFLCTYKKAYFSNFNRINGGLPLALTERECHFHGAAACIYELSPGH